MLEVTNHIIILDDTVPQINFSFVALRKLLQLRIFKCNVIEVGASSVLLRVPQNRLGYSGEVSVVLAVPFFLNVLGMEFL